MLDTRLVKLEGVLANLSIMPTYKACQYNPKMELEFNDWLRRNSDRNITFHHPHGPELDPFVSSAVPWVVQDIAKGDWVLILDSPELKGIYPLFHVITDEQFKDMYQIKE